MSCNSSKKLLHKNSSLQKSNMPLQVFNLHTKKCIYYIYILQCDGNVLYTGIATDYKRRLDEHFQINNSKKGAKFTKSHKPEKIVALWKTKTRSDASKLEIRIKRLSKSDKLLLINDNKYFKEFFTYLIDCRRFRRVL